jgi:hypothetical protein
MAVAAKIASATATKPAGTTNLLIAFSFRPLT